MWREPPRAVVLGAIKDFAVFDYITPHPYPLPQGAREKTVKRHEVRPQGHEQHVVLQVFIHLNACFSLSFPYRFLSLFASQQKEKENASL